MRLPHHDPLTRPNLAELNYTYPLLCFLQCHCISRHRLDRNYTCYVSKLCLFCILFSCSRRLDFDVWETCIKVMEKYEVRGGNWGGGRGNSVTAALSPSRLSPFTLEVGLFISRQANFLFGWQWEFASLTRLLRLRKAMICGGWPAAARAATSQRPVVESHWWPGFLWNSQRINAELLKTMY